MPHCYLLGFLITVKFYSHLTITFFTPFLVLPSTKLSVQSLPLFFKPFSKHIVSSLREILVPAVKMIICFKELHVTGKNLYFSLSFLGLWIVKIPRSCVNRKCEWNQHSSSLHSVSQIHVYLIDMFLVNNKLSISVWWIYLNAMQSMYAPCRAQDKGPSTFKTGS